MRAFLGGLLARFIIAALMLALAGKVHGATSGGFSLVTDTNGVILASTNLFSANSNLLAKSVGNLGTITVSNLTERTSPTNLALANTNWYFVYASTNGQLLLAPYATNDWYWVTNAAGGISNRFGPVTLLGIVGSVAQLTNGWYISPTLSSPITTNLVNYGNPVSSRGSGTSSEAFGSASSASGTTSLAVGNTATATKPNSMAVGPAAQAGGTNSIAVGNTAVAVGNSAIAVGNNAAASASNSVAVGFNSLASHSDAVAVGTGATTDNTNQVMLGASGINVKVNNYLQVGGGATFASGVTNLWHSGTNTFGADADVAFTRKSVTSLATGNNAAVPIGTNCFIEVSGPSGAFTVNGIASGRDGKLIIILNQTGQNMTIAHESGTDPVAANRITSMTGADQTTTGNGAATLIYSGSASRWILLSFAP